MGDVVTFRARSRRCCDCTHWTPNDGLSPLGFCAMLDEPVNEHFVCDKFKIDPAVIRPITRSQP